MSNLKMGDATWECIGAEGRIATLPRANGTTPAVTLPDDWWIFGPFDADAEVLDVRQITTIPETLTVGTTSVKGQKIQRNDDTLDLSLLFGGTRLGQQAYLLTELTLPAEMEVTVGVGVGWWMQWWIDGHLVYDSMALSSFASPPTHTDDSFSVTLSEGGHLISVRGIAPVQSWIIKAAVLSPQETALMQVQISDQWRFLPEEGEIRPPNRYFWNHHVAIRTDLCLADETIECEYQQPMHSGNFGIIFGAQDSGHYYWAQIPHWGQLWRARAFYAAISVADGSGYIRNLKMQLMPNVPCHMNIWRSLKVRRRGNQIQMWVNGVRGPCVTDERYGPGRVGLAGFAKFRVRNLKIDGRPVEGPAWEEGDHRGRPWFQPVPDPELGDMQAGASLLQLSEDEILMSILIGRKSSCHTLHAGNSATYLYLSHDRGRTWSQYATPQETVIGPWWVPEPGVIRTVAFNNGFTFRDSRDKGMTWSPPTAGRLLGDWNRDLFREKTWNWLYGFARLNDGTLLSVILHGYEGIYATIPNYGQGTWGGEIAQPYCTLSYDQGYTWSEPVPMDNAASKDGDKPDSPCGGFSETAVAQLPSGRIVAIARPFRSPFMWQTHSEDGGKTWRMACYAPFSGAGGPVLVATRSGYLALIKRGPGCGLHISTDGGVNWDEGTMIDFPESFNGSAFEVEPDVILVVYPQSMDEIRPSCVRAQRIRIMPDGPIPLFSGEPA